MATIGDGLVRLYYNEHYKNNYHSVKIIYNKIAMYNCMYGTMINSNKVS